MTNKTFENKALRHGELLIIPVADLPGGLETEFEGSGAIIGHSETGHHHVIEGDVLVYKPISMAWQPNLYKQVCKQVFGESESLWPDELVPFEARSDGKIVHQKTFDVHPALDVMKGLYVKYVKTQFNYFTGLLERVRD